MLGASGLMPNKRVKGKWSRDPKNRQVSLGGVKALLKVIQLNMAVSNV